MKDMYTVIYQIYLAFLWTSLFNFNYIIIVPSIEKNKSQEKNNYVLRNESQLLYILQSWNWSFWKYVPFLYLRPETN